MKDAKGHGSDPRGGAAHQQGVDDATRLASFKAARQKQDQLEAESTRTGRVMDSFPKGPMNLTPDSVRASPEWKAAKAASDKAFQDYRNFNGMMVKAFPNELKVERDAKRAGGATHDVTADHDKREYYVVNRASGNVVATYPYKERSELSRGSAHGRANMHRLELNRKA